MNVQPETLALPPIANPAKSAQQRHIDVVSLPDWPNAMITLIGNKPHTVFAWNKGTDIQSILHLMQIVYVCKKTFHVQHELVTKKVNLIQKYREMYRAFPVNLNVTLEG